MNLGSSRVALRLPAFRLKTSMVGSLLLPAVRHVVRGKLRDLVAYGSFGPRVCLKLPLPSPRRSRGRLLEPNIALYRRKGPHLPPPWAAGKAKIGAAALPGGRIRPPTIDERARLRVWKWAAPLFPIQMEGETIRSWVGPGFCAPPICCPRAFPWDRPFPLHSLLRHSLAAGAWRDGFPGAPRVGGQRGGRGNGLLAKGIPPPA